MRLAAVLASILFGGYAFAGDPPPPASPGEEWQTIAYTRTENHAGIEEQWRFGSKNVKGGTLAIIKRECSPCIPIGTDSVRSTNEWPNDAAILVKINQHPGLLAFSVEPRDYNITSYSVVTERHSFHLQLTLHDTIPARESMKLQQALLRMVSRWEPL